MRLKLNNEMIIWTTWNLDKRRELRPLSLLFKTHRTSERAPQQRPTPSTSSPFKSVEDVRTRRVNQMPTNPLEPEQLRRRRCFDLVNCPRKERCCNCPCHDQGNRKSRCYAIAGREGDLCRSGRMYNATLLLAGIASLDRCVHNPSTTSAKGVCKGKLGRPACTAPRISQDGREREDHCVAMPREYEPKQIMRWMLRPTLGA